MIVIADTTPINHLVLMGEEALLGILYGRVIIPKAVLVELQARSTPAPVRTWISKPPSWLQVRHAVIPSDSTLDKIGSGEREAIALAEQLRADAILMDDKDGRREALRRNLRVIGTLAVLGTAADRGLLDLGAAVQRLQQTGFRVSQALVQEVLARHLKTKSG